MVLVESHAVCKEFIMPRRIFIFIYACLLCGVLCGGEWPTYRADSGRSAVTEEKLPSDMALKWVFKARQGPRPAWPESEGHVDITFDWAYHVTTAGGRVYFGSSADDCVYCLDADSGRVLWTYPTGGPVRCAPTLWRGRVFAACDDGLLYCLDASTGKKLWTFRAGPREDRIIGNGRMISRWPLRSGAVVYKDILYCAAGVWPTEGVFFYAIDPKSGREIWCNDSAGYRYIDLAHTAPAFSGVAPQGYLALTENTIFVATGRSVPAALARSDGTFLYWRPAENYNRGGDRVIPAGGLMFNLGREYYIKNKIMGFRENDGSEVFAANGVDIVYDGNSLYTLAGGTVSKLDLRAYLSLRSKSFPGSSRLKHYFVGACRQWYIHHGVKDPRCMVKAGDMLFIGGKDKIVAVQDTAADITALAPSFNYSLNEGKVKKAKLTLTKKADGLSIDLVEFSENSSLPAGSWDLFLDFRNFHSPDYGRGAFQYVIAPGGKKATGLLSTPGLLRGAGPAHPAVKLACMGLKDSILTNVFIEWTEIEKLVGFRPVRFRFAVRLKNVRSYTYYAGDFSQYSTFGWKEFNLKKDAKPVGLTKPKVVWSSEPRGIVEGLSVSNGRLFASTREGPIYCYANNKSGAPANVTGAAETDSAPKGAVTSAYASLAERIIRETNITKGYCLDYGSADGKLAFELAKRTELKIICVEPDEKKAVKAREMFQSAGLYGERISVYRGGVEKLSLPDYFANLIVFGDRMENGLRGRAAREILRVLRPITGVCYVEAKPKAKNIGDIKAWLGMLKGASLEKAPDGTFYKLTRNPLAGAGDWSHQWGNPGRTNASSDTILKGPLELLWYGAPGPGRIIDRHKYPSQQLAVNGRLYIAGKDSITCVDAYNGTELWRTREAGGGRLYAPRNGGKMAADDENLYVLHEGLCLRFDGGTGKIIGKYPVPVKDKKYIWGYLGYDGDILIGTAVESPEKYDEGEYLFALNKKTGLTLWTYKPVESISVHKIVIGDGRVIFVDGTANRKRSDLRRRNGAKYKSLLKYVLAAKNLKTGKKLWATTQDMDHRGEFHLKDGVLLVNKSYPEGGKLAAYNVSDAKRLWGRSVKYEVDWRLNHERAPVIAGDRIITWGCAFDLKTGKQIMRTRPVSYEQKPWSFTWSYGCGTMSGSENMVFSRSGTLGIYDLEADDGVSNFGGMRTGCSNNFIPAGGLLLLPEASAGCSCNYNFQTSLALKPATRKREYWTYYKLNKGGALKHLAINAGAPGHRRDSSGLLWFSYPGPNYIYRTYKNYIESNATNIIPVLQRNKRFYAYIGNWGQWGVYPGPWNHYYHRNWENLTIEGADRPWIFTSGVRGVSYLIIQGTNPNARYTIRLFFAEIFPVVKGQRVFNIKLNGKIVISELDVVAEAGGRNRALVREIKGLSGSSFRLDFIPRRKPWNESNVPIISGIEVFEEK